MYLDMNNTNHSFGKKYVWKLKVTLRIQKFTWYPCGGVILIRNNLVKCRWNGDKKCCHGDQEETIHHLFFYYPFARLRWPLWHLIYLHPPLSRNCLVDG